MLAHQLEEETPEPEEKLTGVILCVDDEAQILSSLKRLFRRAGHTTITLGSGAEGLEYLKENAVDLVISDMRMPEMDGNRFLTEVATQWPSVMRMLLTGYSDMESTVGAINNGHIYRYIAKPWDDSDLLLSVQRALESKNLRDDRNRLNRLAKEQNQQLQELNGSLEEKVARRTKALQETATELEKSNQQIQTAYTDSVTVFARIIGMREGESSSHGDRIAELCELVAQELGLDDEQRRDIGFAAQLHDIGKMAMSDKLLQTPFETQTEEQKEIYKQHSSNGQAILMSLGPLQNAANIIRSHHERVDGTGYPDQLKGDEISIGAKILNVANEFDDLLSGALLGTAMDQPSAIQFLTSNIGRRFDSAVVKAFINVHESRQQVDVISKVLILSVEDLLPGMMLAEDVYLRENVLMLRSGQQLTENFIEKFKSLCQDSDEAFLVKIRT